MESLIRVRAFGGALCCIVGALGCSDARSGTQWIELSQANSLGVTALEIQQSGADGETVFELRGLDASDHEVGSVRLHIGTISDIQALLPGTSAFGSELIVTVEDQQMRMVSRQTRLFRVGPYESNLQTFLGLQEVTNSLQQQHIELNQPAGQEVAYGEGPPLGGSSCPIKPHTEACDTGLLYSTPPADGCCMATGCDADVDESVFIRPSDGVFIERYSLEEGEVFSRCTSETGAKGCKDTGCYFGPLGWSPPQVFTVSGTPDVYIENIGSPGDGTMCGMGAGGTNAYPNATGIVSRNTAGCCPNGTGPCGWADYPACSTCGTTSDPTADVAYWQY
jgi:hypothetical protein